MKNFRALVDKYTAERPTQDDLAETFFRLFGAKVGISPDDIDRYFSLDDFVPHGKNGDGASSDTDAAVDEMFVEDHLRSIFTLSCDYMFEHFSKLSSGYIRMDHTKVVEAAEEVTEALFEYEWCIDGRKTDPKSAEVNSWVDSNRARITKALEEALLETSQHHFPDKPDLLVNGPQKGNGIT